ncbi:hypothetical protein JD844_003559 [Phrynosoma platyrhinos]|uniref:Uncharacterized protein n=1 Tax=Phrynosoma platyrhinos TaxID=52577 RepID=A0ABQ7TD71_PHRPL|nr:hypothetical protein JD844_003559 [Phrynosoma platyrhinos]
MHFFLFCIKSRKSLKMYFVYIFFYSIGFYAPLSLVLHDKCIRPLNGREKAIFYHLRSWRVSD